MKGGLKHFLIFLCISGSISVVQSIKCYKCDGCDNVTETTKIEDKCNACKITVHNEHPLSRRCAQKCVSTIGGVSASVCCDTDLCNTNDLKSKLIPCYHCLNCANPEKYEIAFTQNRCVRCETHYFFKERADVVMVERRCADNKSTSEGAYENYVVFGCYSAKCNNKRRCFNCTNCDTTDENTPWSWQCDNCVTMISKSNQIVRSCSPVPCQSGRKGNVIRKCCHGDKCNNETNLSFDKEYPNMPEITDPNVWDPTRPKSSNQTGNGDYQNKNTSLHVILFISLCGIIIFQLV